MMIGVRQAQLLTAPAYASTPKGNIDGVASAARQLRGWACLQGSAQSVGVDVYVGGVKGSLGSRSIGSYNADQPSEAAVATACQSTGTHYRFLITFSASTIATHGGEPIYVYLTQSTVALSNSGNVRVPLPDPANDYVETVTYIQTDQQGSTVMETDAQGKLLAQTDYTPFGATLTRAAEAPGYTGHYEDPTTGLTYMQARYYDGELARFLSVDPTPATPGDLGTFNRYAYARNNPMGYTDPDGRSADPGEAKTLEEVNVFAGFYGGGGMLSGGGLARSHHSYNYERYVPPADPGKAVTLATMQVTASTRGIKDPTGFSYKGFLVGKPSATVSAMAAWGGGFVLSKDLYSSSSSIGKVTPAMGLSASADVNLIDVAYHGSNSDTGPVKFTAGGSVEFHYFLGGRLSFGYAPPSTFNFSFDGGVGIGTGFYIFSVEGTVPE